MNKIVCTISLLCITLLMTFQNGLVVAYFYANQSEIVQKYCENKDKPQLHCDGKCYLKKQIVQAESQKQEQQSNIRLNYLVLEAVLGNKLICCNQLLTLTTDKPLFFYEGLNPQSVVFDIFHPPA